MQKLGVITETQLVRDAHAAGLFLSNAAIKKEYDVTRCADGGLLIEIWSEWRDIEYEI